jgi:hypothetical protein
VIRVRAGSEFWTSIGKEGTFRAWIAHGRLISWADLRGGLLLGMDCAGRVYFVKVVHTDDEIWVQIAEGGQIFCMNSTRTRDL